jgi:hypothetical protein
VGTSEESKLPRQDSRIRRITRIIRRTSSEVGVLTESASRVTEEDTLLTDHHRKYQLAKTDYVVDVDPATEKRDVERQRRPDRQRSQMSSSVDMSSRGLQSRYREHFQPRQSTSPDAATPGERLCDLCRSCASKIDGAEHSSNIVRSSKKDDTTEKSQNKKNMWSEQETREPQ